MADNVNGDVSTQTQLSLGGSLSGIWQILETSTDVDWFWINLYAGNTYKLVVFINAAYSELRPNLGIYDADGTQITQFLNQNRDVGAFIDFTPSNTGKFFIGVSASSKGGTYKISAEALKSAPILSGTPSPTNTYIENNAAIALDPSITISDADDGYLSPINFNGGYLRVDLAGDGSMLGDQLTIANKSVDGVRVWTSGNQVLINGNSIGAIDNVLNGLNGQSLKINLGSEAYAQNTQALARAINYQNTSDSPPSSRTATLAVQDGSTTLAASRLITINVTPVDDPLIITGSPSALFAYSEDGASVLIDSTIAISDPDRGNLTGGYLQAELTRAGSKINDRLLIMPGGGISITNVIVGGLSKTSVRYTGIEIGLIDDSLNGADGNALRINLNENATITSTQLLAQALGFNNYSQTSSTISGTITVTLNGGGASPQVATYSNPFTVNKRYSPILGGSVSPLLTYVQNNAILAIDNSITISDPDSPTSFDGGYLQASITSAGSLIDDQLVVMLKGGISIVNSSVRGVKRMTALYYGVEIGFVDNTLNGVNGKALKINLNADANPASTQALARAIGFVNISNIPSTEARTVTFTFSDGTGTALATRNAAITVTAVNDAPLMTGPIPANPLAYSATGAPIALISKITVSDPDNPASFNGGSLRVVLTGYYSGDQLSVIAGAGISLSGSNVTYSGSVIGTIDANDNGVNTRTLLITLNTNATIAATQALVLAIGFKNTLLQPSMGTRTATYTLNDGSGGIATRTAKVVIAVPPTLGVEGTTATAGYTENATPVVILPNLTIGDANNPASFAGGYIQAAIGTGYASSDQLSIIDQGTGSGQIGVSGSNILYSNVIIGAVDATYNGGGIRTLRINLNNKATIAATQALARTFGFSNTSEDPGGTTRVITFTMSDGSIAPLATLDANVNVTPVNDAPSIGGVQSFSISKSPTIFSLDLLADATDPDRTDTLRIISARYSVNAGSETTTTPAGLSLVGNKLDIDLNNANFSDLLYGQSKQININYVVGDGNGATVTQVKSITINGANTIIQSVVQLSAATNPNPPAPNDSPGFMVKGEISASRSGWSISAAGDVNGDGFDDLIVGAFAVNSNAGRSYVVFGKAYGSDTNLANISTPIAGQNLGFAINGEASGDKSGWSVSAAGDVNGDGLGDLILGAFGVNSRAGRSYVVFGKATNSAIDLRNITTPIVGQNLGFAINGEASGNNSGWSVSKAGDINGDGLGDLIIGAWSANAGTGRSYVVFGKATNSAIDLRNITTPIVGQNLGFAITGESYGDAAGWAASTAGDVNGDGLDDLIIGAYNANGGTGRSYVVFGKATNSAIDLRNITTPIVGQNLGFAIIGEALEDMSGISVSRIGDVNGDGLSDLVVGASGVSNRTGRAYVVFGKKTNSAISLRDITIPKTGQNLGFVITGESPFDAVGESVFSAGDINGDGLSDLIIGAYGSSGSGANSGRSYVVFGKRDSSAIALSSIANGIGGFAIKGAAGDFSGFSVSAGDINGDGLNDLIVGADSANMDAGRTYIIYGSVGRFYQTNIDYYGTNGDDIKAGDANDETFVGGDGNDTLIGGGGADILYGGNGNDILVLNYANVTFLSKIFNRLDISQLPQVDGGGGFDTLKLDGRGIFLNLIETPSQSRSASKISNIERIDITGSGVNALVLSASEIMDIANMNWLNNSTAATLGLTKISGSTYSLGSSELRHQLLIEGDLGDTVYIKNWGSLTIAGTYKTASATYNVYNNLGSAVQLLINSNVQVAITDTVSPTARSARIIGATNTFQLDGNSFLRNTSQMSIGVTYSEAVIAKDVPKLYLRVGGKKDLATYQSGSGTDTLTFIYTPEDGASDLDGIEVLANGVLVDEINLITDLTGNLADATIPATILNASYRVYLAPPKVIKGSTTFKIQAANPANIRPSGTALLLTGDIITITVSFNEAIFVTGVPKLILSINGRDVWAQCVGSSVTDQLDFQYTIPEALGGSNSIEVRANGLALDSSSTIRNKYGISISSISFDESLQYIDLPGVSQVELIQRSLYGLLLQNPQTSLSINGALSDPAFNAENFRAELILYQMAYRTSTTDRAFLMYRIASLKAEPTLGQSSSDADREALANFKQHKARLDEALNTATTQRNWGSIITLGLVSANILSRPIDDMTSEDFLVALGAISAASQQPWVTTVKAYRAWMASTGGSATSISNGFAVFKKDFLANLNPTFIRPRESTQYLDPTIMRSRYQSQWALLERGSSSARLEQAVNSGGITAISNLINMVAAIIDSKSVIDAAKGDASLTPAKIAMQTLRLGGAFGNLILASSAINQSFFRGSAGAIKASANFSAFAAAPAHVLIQVGIAASALFPAAEIYDQDKSYANLSALGVAIGTAALALAIIPLTIYYPPFAVLEFLAFLIPSPEAVANKERAQSRYNEANSQGKSVLAENIYKPYLDLANLYLQPFGSLNRSALGDTKAKVSELMGRAGNFEQAIRQDFAWEIRQNAYLDKVDKIKGDMVQAESKSKAAGLPVVNGYHEINLNATRRSDYGIGINTRSPLYFYSSTLDILMKGSPSINRFLVNSSVILHETPSHKYEFLNLQESYAYFYINGLTYDLQLELLVTFSNQNAANQKQAYFNIASSIYSIESGADTNLYTTSSLNQGWESKIIARENTLHHLIIYDEGGSPKINLDNYRNVSFSISSSTLELKSTIPGAVFATPPDQDGNIQHMRILTPDGLLGGNQTLILEAGNGSSISMNVGSNTIMARIAKPRPLSSYLLYGVWRNPTDEYNAGSDDGDKPNTLDLSLSDPMAGDLFILINNSQGGGTVATSTEVAGEHTRWRTVDNIPYGKEEIDFKGFRIIKGGYQKNIFLIKNISYRYESGIKVILGPTINTIEISNSKSINLYQSFEAIDTISIKSASTVKSFAGAAAYGLPSAITTFDVQGGSELIATTAGITTIRAELNCNLYLTALSGNLTIHSNNAAGSVSMVGMQKMPQYDGIRTVGYDKNSSVTMIDDQSGIRENLFQVIMDLSDEFKETIYIEDGVVHIDNAYSKFSYTGNEYSRENIIINNAVSLNPANPSDLSVQAAWSLKTIISAMENSAYQDGSTYKFNIENIGGGQLTLLTKSPSI